MTSLTVTRTRDLTDQTAQTSGMHRLVALSDEVIGSRNLWAGHVTMAPSMKSGAHHHGEAESIIFVISGRARFRWGDHLEHTVDAEPGDFIFVPAGLVHQEINAQDDAPVEAIVVRDRSRDMVINVDVPEA